MSTSFPTESPDTITPEDWRDGNSPSEFESLTKKKQTRILYDQAENIPFKYAKHAWHEKMREFLKHGVVDRCNIPTILYHAFPRITQFRQNSSRGTHIPIKEGEKSMLKVDFSSRNSGEFGVDERKVSHELMHAFLNTNGIRMPGKAYRRDGRTDRAWYWNKGFPNWDFNDKDKPPMTYIHRYKNFPMVPEDELEEIYATQITHYKEQGLIETEDDTHAPEARANPFNDGVQVLEPSDDMHAFEMFIEEANVAWYTTAKAFSDGYEEYSRHNVFLTDYAATNPEEFACTFHDYFQKPGTHQNTRQNMMKAVIRHPRLLYRYLSCFNPNPDKEDLLERLLPVSNKALHATYMVIN